jgi:hypothetical protein
LGKNGKRQAATTRIDIAGTLKQPGSFKLNLSTRRRSFHDSPDVDLFVLSSHARQMGK